MRSEAQARIKINKLLEKSGWRFFEDNNGKANIILENNTKITQKTIDEYGNNFEKLKNGFIDFLLLDNEGFPLAVLEAKSENKSPLDGKEQARRYAKSQNVNFIILSNGNLHYFWNMEKGNPYVITKFPTPESLNHVKSFNPNPSNLLREEVKEDYVVLTQNPHYFKDPRWNDEKRREDFIKENGLKFLRKYQIEAVHALQDAVKQGLDRFLFEMATGTGKTLVSAAVIKLFLRSGNAHRVLFLVDRLELEDQAWKNFARYLKNDYKALIYKENKDDWRTAEIVVTTVQSLLINNKYQKHFSPTDFDLVISDEAHRSISGDSRAVFEYFVGYKLGLTATPKDYLKNLDVSKLNKKDPRKIERRQLLDTYVTFGCPSGEPTFRYSLIDAVKKGYLINPFVIDARTEITTALLSELGYFVTEKNDDGEYEEKSYTQKDFEKKFYSEETNKIFCKTFMENALKDPITGEIGKTIVFCVSQEHASKITQILNEFAHLLYLGKYNSDFAVQVSSNIQDAQQFAINFSNNNLNGHTGFYEGYKSSKTRVCVTVGMMTTGYDCQDILNICLMRAIFSPTDFIQIKGRGTRKYTFVQTLGDGFEDEKIHKEKEKFYLFDFFANCEYFEETFDYDQVLELPSIGKRGTATPGETRIRNTDKFESIIPDPLKTYVVKEIGIQGMKIDRKLFEKFEETVKANSFIQENFENGNIELVEDYIKKEIFEKPEDYFNLEKLRKALKLDRRLNLREVLDKIFGRIENFKNKDEMLEEEIDKFISIYKPESQYIIPIRTFIKAYITDSEVRDIVEKKEYGRFATNPMISINDFKELGKWRNVIPEYIIDYVPLNAYM